MGSETEMIVVRSHHAANITVLVATRAGKVVRFRPIARYASTKSMSGNEGEPRSGRASTATVPYTASLAK